MQRSLWPPMTKPKVVEVEVLERPIRSRPLLAAEESPRLPEGAPKRERT